MRFPRDRRRPRGAWPRFVKGLTLYVGRRAQDAGDQQAERDQARGGGERPQRADLVAEEADQRRAGEEGEIADRGDDADPAGGVRGFVGGGAHADREPERDADAPQRGARHRHRERAAEDDQHEPDDGAPPNARVVVTRPWRSSTLGPNQRASVIAREEDRERQRAERRRRVVAVDRRDGEPVDAGALGEGHAEDEQADQQRARLRPGLQRAAARALVLGVRHDGQEVAHGRGGGGGDDHGHREQVRGHRDAEHDHRRAAERARDGPDAEAGVEARHDRAPDAAARPRRPRRSSRRPRSRCRSRGRTGR